MTHDGRHTTRGVPAEVVEGLASGRLVTTSEAVRRLGGGVSPGMLRDWLRRPKVALDVVRHTTGEPVRVPCRSGRENVLIWEQVEAVNAAMIASNRGKPRGARTRARATIGPPG